MPIDDGQQQGTGGAQRPLGSGELDNVFRKLPSEPLAGERAPLADDALRPRLAARDEGGGFTQLFQALSSGVVADQSSLPRSVERAPRERDSLSLEANLGTDDRIISGSSQTAPGEFTRMFQSLRHEGDAPPPIPVRNMPPTSDQGGFTQLLRTLSDEDVADYEVRVTPPRAQPSVPEQIGAESGPGEITRVISGSMLREAQGRTTPGNVAARGAEQAVEETRSGSGGSHPERPLATSLPSASAVSAASSLPHLGVRAETAVRDAASVVAPSRAMHEGLTPKYDPTTKAPTQAKTTNRMYGNAAASTTGLSRYTPLLLLANLLATLLTLVIVLMLLMKR